MYNYLVVIINGVICTYTPVSYPNSKSVGRSTDFAAETQGAWTRAPVSLVVPNITKEIRQCRRCVE